MGEEDELGFNRNEVFEEMGLTVDVTAGRVGRASLADCKWTEHDEAHERQCVASPSPSVWL